MSDLFSGPDPADAWDRRIEAEEGDSLPTVDGIYVSDDTTWKRVKVTRTWRHKDDDDYGVAFDILDQRFPNGKPYVSHSAMPLSRFNKMYRPGEEPLTKERFMEIHNMASGDGLRGQIMQALCDEGAICGDCGDEPGERNCPDCEGIYKRYADAVMAEVEQRDVQLLSEYADRAIANGKRAEKAEKERDDLHDGINQLLKDTIKERTGRRRAEKVIERVEDWLDNWRSVLPGDARRSLEAALEGET